jgi:hypothetical protein
MNNKVIGLGFILTMFGVFLSYYGLELINQLQYTHACNYDKVECEKQAEWALRNFYIGLGIGLSSMLIIIGGLLQDIRG